MLDRSHEQTDLVKIVETMRGLIDAATRKDAESFSREAQNLCDLLGQWRGSRLMIPRAIDDGLAVSTIVQHRPRKNPPTTRPREFDTLFFAALFLMQVVGMSLTFHYHPRVDAKKRCSLRGELSSVAGMRMYVARIILNAEPGHNAQFNEDHHSYRLRDLIQRNGGRGGMLPDGKLGRQAAIDKCSERYEAECHEHHAELSPGEYRKLLTDLLAFATIFHGEDAGQ
jgi:hypothetical protein